MIGVNLAGAEFGSGRGIYGTDYVYPSASELDYYHSKGVTLIRLPFGWERMQPTLGGALNPAELGHMVQFLNAAAQRGMQVEIDLHNFGRYDGQVIGSAAVPITAFQDFWSKLAGALAGYSAVWGFGLMNEPHDMGGPNVWPTAAQAAVDAIRATGSRETIVVSGDNWSTAEHWQGNNSHLFINDPLGAVLYEAHVYFDHAGSGVYGGYDAEGAYPTIGIDRVRPFIDWLAANNLHGFIGEFGVPDSDPRWLPVLNNFLADLSAHDIPGTYWAGGPWWGSYSLAIEPTNGADRPQMDVLEHYTDGAPGGQFGHASAGNDFNGDGNSDILWRQAGGEISEWQMNGTQIVSNLGVAAPGLEWKFQDTADLNGDGISDVMWRHTNGQVVLWQMNGNHIVSNTSILEISNQYHVQGIGDFNGDGKSDVLFRHDSGQVVLWQMDGDKIAQNTAIANPSRQYHIEGVGDFGGDGKSDIMLRDDSGQVVLWQMDGDRIIKNTAIANVSQGYHVVGIGDLNGDGKSDVVWRHDSGQFVLWQMDGDKIIANTAILAVSNQYKVQDVHDYNGDGMDDILLRHDSGQVVLWQMNGDKIAANTAVATVGTDWTIQSHHFDLL